MDIYQESLVAIARKRSLDEGLALDFKRVDALKRVAVLLQEQIFDQGLPEEKSVQVTCPECGETITVDTGHLIHPFPNLWTRDVKIVGRGEDAQRVDVEKFNAPLLNQYRAVLDDLAKESGDRYKDSADWRAHQKILAKVDVRKISLKQDKEWISGEELLSVLLKPYFFDRYLDATDDDEDAEDEYAYDPEAGLPYLQRRAEEIQAEMEKARQERAETGEI